MYKMDQLKKGLLFCLTTILFYGCKPEDTSIAHIWFYTYSTGSRLPPDTVINAASFLDLRNDGTYTLDFSRFESGTWEMASRATLVLINDKKKPERVAVDHVSAKILRIALHGYDLEFNGLPNRGLPVADDPFTAVNNRWRLRANTKESDKQIADRLTNHFRFWQTYFHWALDQQIDYIDVRSTPTPIKIYGNGVALKPFEQLPPAWKNYFYDEEDCRKANDKIKLLFDNNSIAWPQTDNKYKMFLSAFQQMEQKMQ